LSGRAARTRPSRSSARRPAGSVCPSRNATICSGWPGTPVLPAGAFPGSSPSSPGRSRRSTAARGDGPLCGRPRTTRRFS
jgi:hypothetical protein